MSEVAGLIAIAAVLRETVAIRPLLRFTPYGCRRRRIDSGGNRTCLSHSSLSRHIWYHRLDHMFVCVPLWRAEDRAAVHSHTS